MRSLDMTTVAVIPAYNEEKTIQRSVEAVSAQLAPPDFVVVVDNASSDDTAGRVEASQRIFPFVHLISEETKGTGAACATGFGYAMTELGAQIVQRTDADTTVSPDWTQKSKEYFYKHPEKVSVTGPSTPLPDEFCRLYDKALWPLVWTAYRYGGMLMTRNRFPQRIMVGHNMTIDSTAYTQVGGFDETDISERDEDIDLSRKIHEEFGINRMGYDADIRVMTSLRRIRTIGYAGLIRYYGNPLNSPSKQNRIDATNGNVDIR